MRWNTSEYARNTWIPSINVLLSNCGKELASLLAMPPLEIVHEADQLFHRRER